MTSVPPGWGTDNITAYFDLARKNTFASFANAGVRFKKIAQVEAAFNLVRENLHNPDRVWISSPDPQQAAEAELKG